MPRSRSAAAPVGALVELAVGHPARGVDHRDAVGVLGGAHPQHLAVGAALPVPRGAMALGELVGPQRDPVW
jgi:hypothetical protein